MSEGLGREAFAENDFSYFTGVEKDLFVAFITHPTQVVGVRESLETPVQSVVIFKIENIVGSVGAKCAEANKNSEC